MLTLTDGNGNGLFGSVSLARGPKACKPSPQLQARLEWGQVAAHALVAFKIQVPVSGEGRCATVFSGKTHGESDLMMEALKVSSPQRDLTSEHGQCHIRPRLIPPTPFT